MKKQISLLLVVLMIITTFPIGVSATEDALAEPILSFTDEGNVSTIAGDVTLTFAEGITFDAANLEKITLQKQAEGGTKTDIKGKFYATAEANVVTVKFGRLENGAEYKLTIPSDFADSTGLTIGAAKEYSFTAKDEAYLTNTDFSGYTADEAPEQYQDNLQYIYNSGDFKGISTDYATVVEDGNDKYVRVTTSASGRYGIAVVTQKPNAEGTAMENLLAEPNLNNLANAQDDRVFVVESSVRRSAAGSNVWFGMLFNPDTISSGAITYGAHLNNPYNVVTAGAGSATASTILNADGTTSNPAFAKDEDGWYKPRMVFKEKTQTGSSNVEVDLYNMADNSFVGTRKNDYLFGSTNVSKVGLVGVNSSVSGATMDVTYVAAYPEKLMSILGAESYNGSSRTIVLNMSDDILASSLSNIKLLDSTGADITEASNISVACDNDNRTITVKVGSGLDEGSYTLDLAGVQSANGINMYADGDAQTFAVDAANAKDNAVVAIDAPTPSFTNGGTVSSIAGSVALTFGVDVTKGAEKITLTKNDNTKIKGAYNVTANGNDVTVKFGRLENGVTYKLTVPAGVGGATSALSTDAVFTFTAQDEAYLTNTDFSGYTEGATPTQYQDNLQYIYNSGDFKGVSTDYATVVEDGSDKYVRVTTSPAGRYGIAVVTQKPNAEGTAMDKLLIEPNLNNSVNVQDDRVFVVESSVRRSAAGSNVWFGMLFNPDTISSGTITYGAHLNNPYNVVTASAGSATASTILNADGTTSNPAFAKDADGWYKPRMVFKEKTQTGSSNVEVDLYNMADNGFVGTRKNDYLFGTTNVSKVGLVGVNSSVSGATMDVTYVAAYPERLMSVIKTDAYQEGSSSGVNGSLKLHMSDEILASSVDSITVKQGETIIDNVTKTVGSDREIILTFAKGLAAGEYTVDLSGVKSGKGILMYSESTTKTFTVDEDNAKQTFEATVDCPAGDIDVDLGKITLAFDSAVDPMTIDGITFKKKTGEAQTEDIKGIVEKNVVDDNKVEITFGRLEENAQYVLSIAETVKSDSTPALSAQELALTYTAKVDYDVNLDFDSVATDSTPVTGNNFTKADGWSMSDDIEVLLHGTKQIAEDEADGKYLAVNTNGGTGGYGLFIRSIGGFNSIVGDGGKVFAVDAKVRGAWVDPNATTGNSHLHEIMGYMNGSKASKISPMQLSGDTERGILYNRADEDAGITSHNFIAGADEYYHVRSVVKKANATAGDAKVKVSAYDMNSIGSDEAFAMFDCGDYYQPDNDTLNYIRMGYYVSAATNGGLQIDDVKVFAANAMRVLKTYDYNTASRTIAFAMTDDVDTASLDNVVVTSVPQEGEGVEVTGVEATYNDAKRTITLEFASGLPAGSYSVDLNGVGSINGFDDGLMDAITFTVGDSEAYMTTPCFTTADGKVFVEEVENAENEILLKNATSVNVKASVYGVESCTAFLAVYKDNALVAVKSGSLIDGQIDITIENFKSGATDVKLFVWKDLTTIEPIFAPACL